MHYLKIYFVTLVLVLSVISSYAQKPDEGITFYKPITDYYGDPDTILTMDFSGISAPPSPESFKPLFHLPPVRQDTTGTCWSFSTISFLESELSRLGRKPVKLSEMFVVYFEYIEKARRYVKFKGESAFAQGSEGNAAILRIKQYGIVRASDYSGLPQGEEKHGHRKMYKEMKKYLKFIKQNENWDEEIVIANIKLILNKYIGKPPTTIMVDGNKVTPLEYATKILQLPLDDYVDFMSFKYVPFYTKGEYRVPDNWWHSKEYYNLPLDEWYKAIKQAIKEGFPLVVGGDISEVGKYGELDIAIIPSFDIDPQNINQDAREFRFYNESSTDDHLLHVIGYQHYNGYDWFLMKDSAYSATKGKYRGYFFFREDFMKLKMLIFTVHKDAVKNLLEKFNK